VSLLVIGTARVIVYLPETRSLKDKRSILQSLIKKMRNKFNAAIAEVAEQDKWQKGIIGIAVVSGKSVHAESQLQAIIDFMEADTRVCVGEVEIELL
jgi:uncharacterized protein YlxP (DUF503 family)